MARAKTEDHALGRVDDAGKARARALGCRCDVCPLRFAPGPVFPEIGARATFAVIGEAPDAPDANAGRPFVATDGQAVERAFRATNVTRASLALGYAVMCQPPANDMSRLVAVTRTRNARRLRAVRAAAKTGATLTGDDAQAAPLPADACRPALVAFLRELAARNVKHLLPLGKWAAGSLLGGAPSIDAIRGSLLDGNLAAAAHAVEGQDGHAVTVTLTPPELRGDATVLPDARLIPTYTPAKVRFERRYEGTWGRDIDRLVRWQRGALTWAEPQIVYHPRPAALYSFLTQPGPFVYDTETDGIEALSANLRCVGIGHGPVVVIVGIRSRFTRDGRGPDASWYTPAEMAQVHQILAAFFADPSRVKIGHNAGYYDRLVIRQWFGVEPDPTYDTILLHRLGRTSELPHSLGFVGSEYTDVRAWKADRAGRKIAVDAETDHELHHYCAIDVAVTAAVVAPLVAKVRADEQDTLIATDHQVQRVCADMHHVGMYVDQEARAKVEARLLAETLGHREDLRKIAGKPDLNPGSVHALRRLLFDEWKLVPPLDDAFRFTGSGDPSTGDEVIRSLYLSENIDAQQRAFLSALRKYRGKSKELGTYVVKLRPMSELIPQGEDLYDEDTRKALRRAEDDGDVALLLAMREELDDRGYLSRGILWADGRMRPGYNAHITVTGRLSSSSPINAQNFPKHLRKLIVPQPGHVFVGADADQLELRIAAARWGLRRYLDAFDADFDPHTTVTAHAVFGDLFAKAAGSPWPWRNGSKFTGQAYDLRQLSKIIQYAYQYMAAVETGARIIQSTELVDDDGNSAFPYARLDVAEARQMRGAWLKGIPELEKGWKTEIDHFRAKGYVVERIHGRRRYCLNGENPNELVNFGIQASAAAHINDAMIGIWRDIPIHRWGPGTGLLTQTHDALLVECPEAEAPEVAACINAHMNKRHAALPGVLLSASADVGRDWKSVA